jgi:predicted transcriptional regulator
MNHFSELIKRLGKDDWFVLELLLKKDAINKIQALDKTTIILETGIRDYTLRKTIDRLESLLFIEIAKTSRQYEFFLTDFGINAICKFTEGIEA